MANLSVTYDELRNTATRLKQDSNDLQSILSSLNEMIENLTTKGFQVDRASAAYLDSLEKATTGARTAIEGLERLSKFIDSAANVLHQADDGPSVANQS